MVSAGDVCRGSVHWGSVFSCSDMLLYLIGELLGGKVLHKDALCSDELIISKGHGSLAYYSVLAEYGEIPCDFIQEYQKNGTQYTEEMMANPALGIPCTTGSLGLGLPFSLGRAIRKKRAGISGAKVYCLVGDGEMDEGSNWEAAMLASQLELDNLMLFIDLNGLQSDGATDKILSWRGIEQRLSAFGWDVRSADGHDFASLERACAPEAKGPVAVVCHTVKGKGISFMENDFTWHDTAMSEKQLAQARREVGLE